MPRPGAAGVILSCTTALVSELRVGYVCDDWVAMYDNTFSNTDDPEVFVMTSLIHGGLPISGVLLLNCS